MNSTRTSSSITGATLAIFEKLSIQPTQRRATTVYLSLDGERIADVAFQGRGCAISTAAASLMTEVLKGKTVDEARALFAQFHTRVTGGEPAELPEPLAEEAERLEPLTGVKAYPARVKCATLSWHALEAALKGGDAVAAVKTE